LIGGTLSCGDSQNVLTFTNKLQMMQDKSIQLRVKETSFPGFFAWQFLKVNLV